MSAVRRACRIDVCEKGPNFNDRLFLTRSHAWVEHESKGVVSYVCTVLEGSSAFSFLQPAKVVGSFSKGFLLPSHDYNYFLTRNGHHSGLSCFGRFLSSGGTPEGQVAQILMMTALEPTILVGCPAGGNPTAIHLMSSVVAASSAPLRLKLPLPASLSVAKKLKSVPSSVVRLSQLEKRWVSLPIWMLQACEQPSLLCVLWAA